MRSLLCLIAGLVPGLDAHAGCDEASARALVSGFYRHHPSSLADAAAIEAARPRLSAAFQADLQAAADYRARYIEQHPREPSPGGAPDVIYKPPFTDGDMFTGSPDGATAFEVTRTERAADGAWRVHVEALPEPDRSQWKVDAVVRAEREGCVIDDVGYPDHTPPATLRNYLRARVG